MKKIIYMLIVTLFFVSCSNDSDEMKDDVKIAKKAQNGVFDEKNKGEEIEKIAQVKPTKYNDVKIEYNKTKDELQVGQITIKKGVPKELPEYLKAYNDSETYINSNVPNYYFFVTSDDSEKVGKYYTNMLRKSGFTQNKTTNKIDDTNKGYSFTKKDLNVDISVSKDIPENLKKMSLTGSYVEVRY